MSTSTHAQVSPLRWRCGSGLAARRPAPLLLLAQAHILVHEEAKGNEGVGQQQQGALEPVAGAVLLARACVCVFVCAGGEG